MLSKLAKILGLEKVGTFVSLSWPILYAVGLVVFVLLTNNDTLKNLIAVKGDLWLFNVDTRLDANTTRALLIGAAVALCLVPAFRDYSGFFPERFQVEVFFDEEGLQKALQQFSPSELPKIDEQGTLGERRAQYFAKLNSDLTEARIPFQFLVGRGETYGFGQGMVKLELFSRWGMQTYRLQQARGELEFTSTRPGQSVQKVKTTYELLPTEANVFHATLKDIYLRRVLVIRPEFKQLIQLSAANELFHHKLMALSKAKFFPYIDLGRTVYLAEGGNGVVPIGYAVYTPL